VNGEKSTEVIAPVTKVVETTPGAWFHAVRGSGRASTRATPLSTETDVGRMSWG